MSLTRKYDGGGSVLWTRQFGNADIAGNLVGALPGQTTAGSFDVFVQKYDGAGSLLWTRQIGSADYDRAASVSLDGSGNVIVAGETRGAFPGEASTGGSDAYVRKYDGAGTEVWTRQFGTAFHDFAEAVSADGSGNVIVAGFTEGMLPGQTSTGSSDAFVMKLLP